MFSFEVGNGSVIKGWDIAIKTMKVGIVYMLDNIPKLVVLLVCKV